MWYVYQRYPKLFILLTETENVKINGEALDGILARMKNIDPFIKVGDYPFKEIVEYYMTKLKKDTNASYLLDCIFNNKMLSARYLNLKPSQYYAQMIENK